MTTPRPFPTASFISWLIGGVALVTAAWFAGDMHSRRFQTELIFSYINPTPHQVARQQFGTALEFVPWAGVLYAAFGVWAFRAWGCLAIACAVTFGCCALLAFSGHKF